MNRFIVLITILGLVSASGCGGRKVLPTKQAELVVPDEFVKAFEVKAVDPIGIEKHSIKPILPAALPAAVTTSKSKMKIKKESSKSKSEKAILIPNRRPVKDPIWEGEKIWMDVTWLGTKAGEFLLEVLPFKEINNRKVYDIKGTARTSDLFSLIYKAEDWVETFVDFEGWFPYKFILHGDETKHIRDNLELFDHAAKKQYIHIQDNRVQTNEIHEEKGIKDLVPFSQDSLSALYYVRTQSFEIGSTIKFPMTTNGSPWETSVVILNREEVSTKMGYLKAIKTKVETRFNGVMQQQGDSFIWFSDDEHKHPLRFEAKVKIGWVSGIAKKIETGTPPENESPNMPVDQKTTPGSGSQLLRPIDDLEKRAQAEVAGLILGQVYVPQKKSETEVQERVMKPTQRRWFRSLLVSVSSAVNKDTTK